MQYGTPKPAVKAPAAHARAFTLVEVLLSIAITAMLLTALGAAVHTSVQGYTENEKISNMTQSGRTVLARIVRDIRTCDAVDANSTLITIIPADANGPQQVQYEYTGGLLYYRRTVNSVTTSSVLLGSGNNVSISSFTISRTTGADWKNLSCIKDISLKLVLNVGGQTMTVTASASPRRNQTF